MRLKLDENLPTQLKLALNALGHDTDTVRDEHLSGATDSEVFAAAQRAKRFLITHDLDFSDYRRFRPGTHNGVMLLRLDDAKFDAVLTRLVSVFKGEPVETWWGCYVIVGNNRVRVRRPRQ